MSLDIELDLPSSLAPLKCVDTLLRCPICFNFFNITMMTKCSHNFCSLCIRTFLSYKLQCPVCSMETIEQDLRSNRLLDDLVSNFCHARQQLSKASFESPPKTPGTSAVSVRGKKPRAPRSSSTILSQYFQKNPEESKQVPSSSQTIKEEPMEVELLSAQCPVPVKQETTPSVCTGALADSSSLLKDVKPVIKVDCPVCSLRVANNFINKHLDICLASGEKKESLRSKSRRPMAKLVYNLLSQAELKKRLKDCQLSVYGTRDQLIQRLQEFIHINNAQCDSLSPKAVEDIAREVEANEKMRTILQEKPKPVLFSKNLSEDKTDNMHLNDRKQRSGDFTCPIAQVRGRLQTPRSAGISAGGEEVQMAAADPKGTIMIDSEDSLSDEASCFRDRLSSSPTCSEVSVSSSLSDIFGPEPTQKPEQTETTTPTRRSIRKSHRLKDRDLGGSFSPTKRRSEAKSQRSSLSPSKCRRKQ